MGKRDTGLTLLKMIPVGLVTFLLGTGFPVPHSRKQLTHRTNCNILLSYICRDVGRMCENRPKSNLTLGQRNGVLQVGSFNALPVQLGEGLAAQWVPKFRAC